MKERKNGYIYYDYTKKSEKEEVARTAWRSVYRWVCAITAVLFILFSALTFFVRIVSVSGPSMVPTLADGNKLLVYTFNYEPQCGDIVIISSDDSNSPPLVKRVIALPGQTVKVNYKTGTVAVDGQILKEKYIFEQMTIGNQNEISYPYTVPTGKYFVMGDNRNNSQDSRDVALGCIDANRIVGKAMYRIKPISEWNIYN